MNIVEAILTNIVEQLMAWLLPIAIACLSISAIGFGIIGWLYLGRERPDRELDTTANLLHFVRKHAPGGGFYKMPTRLDDAQTVLLSAIHTHWAKTTINEEGALVANDWHDSQHPVDAPSTGRHHVDNFARTIVPPEWLPKIGASRIEHLETETEEIPRWKLGLPHWSKVPA